MLHIIMINDYDEEEKHEIVFGDDILMFRCLNGISTIEYLCVAVVTADNSITIVKFEDNDLTQEWRCYCPSKPMYITDRLVASEYQPYFFAIFCEDQMVFIKGEQDPIMAKYYDDIMVRVVKVIPSIAERYSVYLVLFSEDGSERIVIDVKLDELGNYEVNKRKIPSRLLDYDSHRSRLFEDGRLEVSVYDLDINEYRQLLISSDDYNEDDIIPRGGQTIKEYLNYYGLPERVIFEDVAKAQYNRNDKLIILFRDGILRSSTNSQIASNVTNFQIIGPIIYYMHLDGTVMIRNYGGDDKFTTIDPIGVKFQIVSSYDLPMSGIGRVKSARK